MKKFLYWRLKPLTIVLKSCTTLEEITSNLTYCLEWCMHLQPKSHFTSSRSLSSMNGRPDKAILWKRRTWLILLINRMTSHLVVSVKPSIIALRFFLSSRPLSNLRGWMLIWKRMYNNENKSLLMVVSWPVFNFIFPSHDASKTTVIKCLTLLLSLLGMPAYAYWCPLWSQGLLYEWRVRQVSNNERISCK